MALAVGIISKHGTESTDDIVLYNKSGVPNEYQLKRWFFFINFMSNFKHWQTFKQKGPSSTIKMSIFFSLYSHENTVCVL